jgi:hypothetical protein
MVVDRELLITAGRLQLGSVRTLDAIHLCAALAAGDELGGVVTYDTHMAEAAHLLGLEVAAPA